MKTTTTKPLFIVFVVAIALFLLFSGGAMSGEMMNDGMHGNGWMGDRTWMWIPARVALAVGLALGLVLGWGLFKKKK